MDPAKIAAQGSASCGPAVQSWTTLDAAVVNMRVNSSARAGSPTHTSQSWRRNSRPLPQPGCPAVQVATSRYTRPVMVSWRPPCPVACIRAAAVWQKLTTSTQGGSATAASRYASSASVSSRPAAAGVSEAVVASQASHGAGSSGSSPTAGTSPSRARTPSGVYHR